MTEFVLITKVEFATDKNSEQYKKITVQDDPRGFIQLPNGEWEEFTKLSRTTSVNAWEGRRDGMWSLEEGKKTPGKIVTREVPAYEIIDNATGDVREATRYTAIVFGDTSDKESFEAAVRATFARNGHNIDEVVSAPRVQPIASQEAKVNAELA